MPINPSSKAEFISPFEQSINELPGIGPALAARLYELEIEKISDFWFHLPSRYEDRTSLAPIRELVAGNKMQVEGIVEAVERGFRFKPQLKVAIADGSESTLVLRFFHFTKAQADSFVIGQRIRAFGEVREANYGFEMVHPQYKKIAEDLALPSELTPIYPLTDGVTNTRLAGLIKLALTRLPPDDRLELVPADLRTQYQLGSLRTALCLVHQPPKDVELALLLAGTHPAQRRLAFEELLAHQLSMRKTRHLARRESAPLVAKKNPRVNQMRKAFLHDLPFKFTAAQKRVLQEIDQDVQAGSPMMRLLQGDVGSGKTVVAAAAAITMASAGWQVAVVAPTELLAEQHLRNFSRWLAPLEIKVAWLSSRVQGRARNQTMAALADDAQVVIGTHALMQDRVVFKNLGLVIIDEQHRFGVHQRLSLREKGRGENQAPHQLVMTATPIPRTLAMAMYADLDLSIINELPPGRTPIQTVVLANNKRDEVISRIRDACVQGKQVYWVCTLIEANDEIEAKAAQAAFETLSEALQGIPVGLIHGKLKPIEKQNAMADFIAGKISLLVATTVIEVGVDVPNASLMVIENAERLGLSQLHQLRGRVGRGAAASSCVLLYQTPLSHMARERLNVMRETNDGFRIAEKDLQLRGPGELLGTRQTGELEFRVANLSRDAHELPAIQALADALLARDTKIVDQLIRRWVGHVARYAEA